MVSSNAPEHPRQWRLDQGLLDHDRNKEDDLDSNSLKGTQGKQTEVFSKRKKMQPRVNIGLGEKYRRIDERDLEAALGPVGEREGVVAYVCGPPTMTDWAVAALRRAEGVIPERILCEKWW